VTTYRSRFEHFIEFARLETKQPTVLTSHFTVDLCPAYQYALDRRGCQANTVRTRLATLSSLGKWAVQRGRLDRNPVDQIVRPKRRDRPPRVPRWSVVEELTSNGLDLRAKAIIRCWPGVGCVVPRWRRSTSATSIRPLVGAESAAREGTRRQWPCRIVPARSLQLTWRPTGPMPHHTHRCS
jgi:hypothetical protein